MAGGKEVGGGRRGTGTTKKNAFCSFCRKSYRDVGPLVEGPGDVYICGECIDVLLNVSIWIDDDCEPGVIARNDVAGLGQLFVEKSFENHAGNLRERPRSSDQ